MFKFFTSTKRLDFILLCLLLLHQQVRTKSTDINTHNQNDILLWNGWPDNREISEITALLDYTTGLTFYKDASIPACLVEHPQSLERHEPASLTKVLSVSSKLSRVTEADHLPSSTFQNQFCGNLPIYKIETLEEVKLIRDKRLKRKKRQSHSGSYSGSQAQASGWPASSQTQVQGSVSGQGFFSGQAQAAHSGFSQSQVQLGGKGIVGNLQSSSGNTQSQLSLGEHGGAGQASSSGLGPSNSQVQVNVGQREQGSHASANVISLGGQQGGVGGHQGGVGGHQRGVGGEPPKILPGPGGYGTHGSGYDSAHGQSYPSTNGYGGYRQQPGLGQGIPSGYGQQPALAVQPGYSSGGPPGDYRQQGTGGVRQGDSGYSSNGAGRNGYGTYPSYGGYSGPQYAQSPQQHTAYSNDRASLSQRPVSGYDSQRGHGASSLPPTNGHSQPGLGDQNAGQSGYGVGIPSVPQTVHTPQLPSSGGLAPKVPSDSHTLHGQLSSGAGQGLSPGLGTQGTNGHHQQTYYTPQQPQISQPAYTQTSLPASPSLVSPDGAGTQSPGRAYSTPRDSGTGNGRQSQSQGIYINSKIQPTGGDGDSQYSSQTGDHRRRHGNGSQGQRGTYAYTNGAAVSGGAPYGAYASAPGGQAQSQSLHIGSFGTNGYSRDSGGSHRTSTVYQPSPQVSVPRTNGDGVYTPSSSGYGVTNGRSQNGYTNGYGTSHRTNVNGHKQYLNGHSTNGHSTNGHSTNGHSTNGHSTNGHSTNGHSTNGHGSQSHTSDGHGGVNGHKQQSLNGHSQVLTSDGHGGVKPMGQTNGNGHRQTVSNGHHVTDTGQQTVTGGNGHHVQDSSQTTIGNGHHKQQEPQEPVRLNGDSHLGHGSHGTGQPTRGNGHSYGTNGGTTYTNGYGRNGNGRRNGHHSISVNGYSGANGHRPTNGHVSQPQYATRPGTGTGTDGGVSGYKPSSQGGGVQPQCTVITFTCTIVIESNGRAKLCRPKTSTAPGGNGSGGGGANVGDQMVCCC